MAAFSSVLSWTVSDRGDLPAEYKQHFAKELSHPSVIQLGHRHDVPELMRQADILLMPSIEEDSH